MTIIGFPDIDPVLGCAATEGISASEAATRLVLAAPGLPEAIRQSAEALKTGELLLAHDAVFGYSESHEVLTFDQRDWTGCGSVSDEGTGGTA